MHFFLFISLFLSMICFWNEYSQTTSFEGTEDQNGVDGRGEISSEAVTLPLVWAVPKKFSIFFFFFSFVLLTFDLLNRWLTAKHVPLSNLYESLLFLNWNLITIFFFLVRNEISLVINSGEAVREPAPGNSYNLIAGFTPDMASPLLEDKPSEASQVSARLEQRPLNPLYNSSYLLIGPLVSSTVLFIQAFADWRLPDDIKNITPLIPALQSNWLLMHVSIMILSYAALFIGCLLSILYIGTAWYFNWNTGEGAEGLITAAACDEVVPYTLSTMEAPAAKPYADVAADAAPPLPYSLPWPMQSRKLFFSQLDSLSYRILAFAFPLLTLGILSGSIWANEAWGSYWSWDPKETWAFITWLIFAFYLHTRLQYNWEGQKSALIASIGFFIVWMCYLGVNLLGKGLHSYGWVSPL